MLASEKLVTSLIEIKGGGKKKGKERKEKNKVGQLIDSPNGTSYK